MHSRSKNRTFGNVTNDIYCIALSVDSGIRVAKKTAKENVWPHFMRLKRRFFCFVFVLFLFCFVLFFFKSCTVIPNNIFLIYVLSRGSIAVPEMIPLCDGKKSCKLLIPQVFMLLTSARITA